MKRTEAIVRNVEDILRGTSSLFCGRDLKFFPPLRVPTLKQHIKTAHHIPPRTSAKIKREIALELKCEECQQAITASVQMWGYWVGKSAQKIQCTTERPKFGVGKTVRCQFK